jgi:hypothetical protein
VSFACWLGYGGRIDLVSNDYSIVLDIKTKDNKDLSESMVYDEHIMQLAAYAGGIKYSGLNNKKPIICANVFVSTKKDTDIKVLIVEHKKEEIDRGFNMFLNLLHYWQYKNRYDSYF